MIAFFRKRRFLEAEDEDWHLASWKFMFEHFGGLTRLKASPLVNGTRAFFPPTDAIGHARAEHIFACVKTIAGMADWPCTLAAQPERIRTHVSEYVFLKIIKNDLPLGTFGTDGKGEVMITYDRAILDQPAKLVATLAHELSHYLLAGMHDAVPGGDAMHEFATDLMTVFLGFGLFGANGAFEFAQHGDAFGQGWRYSSAGYLSQRDWVFALAVFRALRDEDTESLKPLLKPHLYVDLQKAAKYLTNSPELLSGLRA
ncbi:MAG: hypothetical protein ACREHE_13060 [Rhizomicrobium sp.]